MSDRVLVNIDSDGIATVTFNRPDKMNALDNAQFEAITAAGEQLRYDRRVRVVVVHGEGRAFCAGLDLGMFSSGGLQNAPLGSQEIGKAPNFYQKVGWVWKEVPVPVIAALHGVCFGGGLQIALGADLRYAHPETKLSVMESKWGLVPDMSGTQTLRDLCRLDVAKELTFTGRIVAAEEAQRLGLVTAVDDDPLARAMAVAKEIASRNPDAAVYAKQLFEQTWHGPTDDGLLLEETLQARLIGSHNQLEAVFSGMQKRPAKFVDRMQDGYYEGDVFRK